MVNRVNNELDCEASDEVNARWCAWYRMQSVLWPVSVCWADNVVTWRLWFLTSSLYYYYCCYWCCFCASFYVASHAARTQYFFVFAAVHRGAATARSWILCCLLFYDDIISTAISAKETTQFNGYRYISQDQKHERAYQGYKTGTHLVSPYVLYCWVF